MTDKEIEKILNRNKFIYFPQIENMQILTETFEKVDDKIVFTIRAFVPDENTDFVCKKIIPIDKLEPITLNRRALTGSDNWHILATFFKELLELKFPEHKFNLNDIGRGINVERSNYEVDNNVVITFRYCKNDVTYNCKIWYDEQDYSFECRSGSSIIKRDYKLPKLFRAYLRKNNFAIK